MKVDKVVIALISISVLAGCNRPIRGNPATSAPPLLPTIAGSYDESITSSGITRHFRVHVPASYAGTAPVPLIFNFHGYQSNSTQQELLSGMSEKAEQSGFIVTYPDGRNETWNDTPESSIDEQFILDLLKLLQSRYAIDSKRVYATGMSNGGGMANRVGCDMSRVFAAIAPVSGAYNFWKNCSPERPMPVIAFHGTADKVVPYAGSGNGNLEPPIPEWAAGWAIRNQCSAAPKVTIDIPDVKRETWDSCKDDASVVLYSIDNHGHSWPGSSFLPGITSQAIDATDVMWDFFVKHPMP